MRRQITRQTHIHTHVMPNERVGANESEMKRMSETETGRGREYHTEICAHIPADVGIFQLSTHENQAKSKSNKNKNKRFRCRIHFFLLCFF